MGDKIVYIEHATHLHRYRVLSGTESMCLPVNYQCSFPMTPNPCSSVGWLVDHHNAKETPYASVGALCREAIRRMREGEEEKE